MDIINENVNDDIEAEEMTEHPDFVDIIGVKFKTNGKVYYFDPLGHTDLSLGRPVIVETARGIEYGVVAVERKTVGWEEIVPPLRPVVRPADKNDIAHYEENKQKEKEALVICAGKVADHGLEMKLIEAEYTFDNSKLIFYFTSDGRVDFRELVKDLASVFKIRIELRQIGIRDEAKMKGGLGVCGRPFCCNSFLPDFVQVSIKMAKEQNLSLNSSKISGACGRLMCCLRFEHDVYEQEIKKTPKIDSVVQTPEGPGVVVESNPLAGTVKVKLSSDPNALPKLFNRKDVIRTKGFVNEEAEQEAESEPKEVKEQEMPKESKPKHHYRRRNKKK